VNVQHSQSFNSPVRCSVRWAAGALGGQVKQLASISAALQVIPHADTAEHSDLALKIDTNDADSCTAVPKKQRAVDLPTDRVLR
jgi:hypothetical protein